MGGSEKIGNMACHFVRNGNGLCCVSEAIYCGESSGHAEADFFHVAIFFLVKGSRSDCSYENDASVICLMFEKMSMDGRESGEISYQGVMILFVRGFRGECNKTARVEIVLFVGV